MKFAALVCGLVAAALGVFSTLLMTRGTRATDWSRQTWSGESESEKAERQLAKRYFTGGLIALAVAFILSAASSLLGYYS